MVAVKEGSLAEEKEEPKKIEEEEEGVCVCQSLNQSVNMTHTNNGIIITSNGHSSHHPFGLFDTRERERERRKCMSHNYVSMYASESLCA